MALQHARKPSLLSDSDYGEQTNIIEQFLGDDRSLPNRPTHLVADQAATGLVFRETLDAMNSALAARKTATDIIKNTVASMDTLIRWMRNILPTLSDESILLPFGLDRKIPDGYAELKDYADTIDAHWQTVKLEPFFAPVAARMDELAPFIATYESARAAQIVANGEYEQRQNEKDIARSAHHEVERLIFNWYIAYYPDGQDIYWENTPWGKAPQKDTGGGSKWDEVPANVEIKFIFLGKEMLVISAPGYTGATGFDVRLAWGPTGGAVATMPGENTLNDVPLPVQYVEEIFHGMTCYAWVRARNGEEVTGWSEPASVDVE